jgi:hypothetical protein
MGLLGVLLLGALAAGQEPLQDDPATAYRNLTREYGKAQREFIAAWRKRTEEAKKSGAKTLPSFSFEELAAEWVPRFQAGADQYAGRDGAIPFLTWIYANSEDNADTLATLLRDHVESPKFGVAVTLIGRSSRLGTARQLELLEQVIEKNPDRDVRAQAMLARAEVRLAPAEEGGTVDESDREAALADLRAALEVVGDEQLRARIGGALNEQEHLQVGMVAPDIAGSDLDGIEFKLSDYRGKVVLLDFWGFW